MSFAISDTDCGFESHSRHGCVYVFSVFVLSCDGLIPCPRHDEDEEKKRKWLWPNWRYCPGIHLTGLMKTTKELRQDSGVPTKI
jgi:hypothetical protein